MRQTALITGASRGIGRAIAIAFAAAGYDLILNCRHTEALLLELKKELEADYSIACRTFVGDMGDFTAVTELFEQIPALDIVVNNAGVAYTGLLSDMTVTDWQNVMNTNLHSAFYTSKLAIPLMLTKHCGKILNISSVWGTAGASMEVAYSASKGGLNAFTRALAKELAPSNIQVNAISCGLIDTDMNQNLSSGELDDLCHEIPADRMGTPEEVAALALQLIQSPTYLTGQIITLDGAWI